MVDLLSQHAAQHGAPVLQGNRRVARDRRQQRPVLLSEGRVTVADQLADLPALPAQLHANCMLPRTALRPDPCKSVPESGGQR